MRSEQNEVNELPNEGDQVLQFLGKGKNMYTILFVTKGTPNLVCRIPVFNTRKCYAVRIVLQNQTSWWLKNKEPYPLEHTEDIILKEEENEEPCQLKHSEDGILIEKEI